MAHVRAQSAVELPKEPHLVSLKVLRLSKPSLAQQFPLPRENGRSVSSLAYPSDTANCIFGLTPGLTLPPAFGSTHVGETFTCSLCVNNELSQDESSKAVKFVRISAEVQTPTQTVPLSLFNASEEVQQEGSVFRPSATVQNILHFDLKEEGNHVLAVSVNYNETRKGPETSSTATSGRSRTFRKLYQFVAQPCLNVRTKTTELPSEEIGDKSFGPYGKSKLLRFILEAQLENVGDAEMILDRANLDVCSPFTSNSLNWDAFEDSESSSLKRPMLKPRDVLQLAYTVTQQQNVTEGVDTLNAEIKRSGRIILGQLSIAWTGPMGERGLLTTGNLMTRRLAT